MNNSGSHSLTQGRLVAYLIVNTPTRGGPVILPNNMCIYLVFCLIMCAIFLLIKNQESSDFTKLF
jgi:hypothetical protein